MLAIDDPRPALRVRTRCKWRRISSSGCGVGSTRTAATTAIRELYRATNARIARKAMKLKYQLNDAHWDRVTTADSDYLREHGALQKRSTRQLNLLDKLTDSRLARSLLRARGPVPAWWWRAAQRQLRAMESNKFGTKEP